MYAFKSRRKNLIIIIVAHRLYHRTCRFLHNSFVCISICVVYELPVSKLSILLRVARRVRVSYRISHMQSWWKIIFVSPIFFYVALELLIKAQIKYLSSMLWLFQSLWLVFFRWNPGNFLGIHNFSGINRFNRNESQSNSPDDLYL